MRYKLLFLLLFIANIAFGQKTKHYCEMRCTWMFKGNYTVQIDFGDVRNPFDYKNNCDVVDSLGEDKRFETEMSALNWMSKRGWKLELLKYHAVSPEYTCYILSKECEDEKIKEGIILKYTIKK